MMGVSDLEYAHRLFHSFFKDFGGIRGQMNNINQEAKPGI